MFRRLLTPNAVVPSRLFILALWGWVAAFVFLWSVGVSVFIPTPAEVLRAFPTLWAEGFAQHLWTSFILNLEALGVMVVLSLAIAYATVMPIFRPFALLFESGRFNGFVGLPAVFLSLFHDAHAVKIALLVYGAGVFTVLSLVQMIESIPAERLDHSRTLRMSEWRVVWEEVVLGSLDETLQIFRVNAAMLWLMLPMVEGLFRFEGGVGAFMLVQDKYLKMDMVFGALFVILAIGLAQDWFIGFIRRAACPWVTE